MYMEMSVLFWEDLNHIIAMYIGMGEGVEDLNHIITLHIFVLG